MGEDRPRAGRGFRLSPRLAAVARLVPRGARVVDVGSGHGRLPAWLAGTDRVAACIAIELDREAGRDLASLVGRPNITVRFGDGLRALVRGEDRPDVLVMSGLGARSMVRILDEAPCGLGNLRRLVLQPQTEIGRLRRWLVGRGFGFVAETLTRDRSRWYVTLAAEPRRAAERPSHPVLDFEDLMDAGPCLVRSREPEVREYWTAVRRRTERALERATGGPGRSRTARTAALARRVLEALDPPD